MLHLRLKALLGLFTREELGLERAQFLVEAVGRGLAQVEVLAGLLAEVLALQLGDFLEVLLFLSRSLLEVVLEQVGLVFEALQLGIK